MRGGIYQQSKSFFTANMIVHLIIVCEPFNFVNDHYLLVFFNVGRLVKWSFRLFAFLCAPKFRLSKRIIPLQPTRWLLINNIRLRLASSQTYSESNTRPGSHRHARNTMNFGIPFSLCLKSFGSKTHDASAYGAIAYTNLERCTFQERFSFN